MIDPFDPEDIPDEVLWEITDPDFVDSLDDLDDFNALYGEDEREKDYNKKDDTLVIPSRPTSKFKDRLRKKLSSKYPDKFPVKTKELPSKYTADYWVHAYSKHSCKQMTGYCGKWLCFVPEKFIDAAWEQIKDATEEGLLGPSSKCSTLFGRKNGQGSDYVCCVFTYDWRNEKDVMRVREVLRDLGFEKPLPYKTDEDTLKGKYASKGHKGISKYYE